MASDPRDEIWAAVWKDMYDAQYQYVLATKLVSRWRFFDDVTKVLVALTASGSAIAGWSLWKDEGYKVVWACVAGTGALIAIFHSSLGVPARVKSWTESWKSFARISSDFETLLAQMRIEPGFDVKAMTQQWMEIRKRHTDAVSQVDFDFLTTRGLRVAAQQEVNGIFGAEPGKS